MLDFPNAISSLSAKITFWMVFLFALALSIGTLLSIYQQEKLLESAVEAQGALLAESLLEILEQKQGLVSEQRLRSFRERFSEQSTVEGIWLYGPGGETLVSTLDPDFSRDREEAEGGGLLTESWVGIRGKPDTQFVRRPLTSPGHPVGSVGVALSARQQWWKLREVRSRVGVLTALVFAAGALVAAAIGRTLSRPLRRLVAATTTQVDPVAPEHDGDEVSQLTDSFQLAASRFAESISKETKMVEELKQQLGEAAQDLESHQQKLHQLALSEQALKEECSLLTAQLGERAEELGKAHADLESTTQVRDQFLASMSHELRTPLNAVLGLSEILRDETYGKVNSRQRSFIDSISQSGKNLLAVINDLLDFARLEAGEHQLEMASISIKEVCQSSLDYIEHDALAKEVELSSLLPSEEAAVYADRRCLKRILLNLLSNAVKFTAQGGRAGLDVRVEEEGQIVHFSVWDTGMGIARADFGLLFRPFVQLDSRLARRFGGTGLGLPLVYQLVELHGGSLSVESEPENGSRFTVSLPLGNFEVRREPQTRSARAHGKRPWPGPAPPLVLIAEDNSANLQTLRAFVETNGFSVLIAENGRQAVELAKSRLPDLVIMDIQMPEMDGLEATRALRQDPHLTSLPIIAVTALAMPGDEERCLAAGVDAFLSKPVRLADLLVTMEDWLHRGLVRGQFSSSAHLA